MIDNLESMSADELRSMLVAKDEMVRELEDAIKEMKADSEAKLTEEKPEDEAEKMAESKDEDEAKKMAESKDEDEAKKMAESKDDEKKSYAMSEGNALLLS